MTQQTRNCLLLAGIMSVLAFALCTGIEQQPIQALPALAMMYGAMRLFQRADRLEREHRERIKNANDNPNLNPNYAPMQKCA